jgi:hypothetical protein
MLSDFREVIYVEKDIYEDASFVGWVEGRLGRPKLIISFPVSLMGFAFRSTHPTR